MTGGPEDPLLAEAAGNPWALHEIAAARREGLAPTSLSGLLKSRVDRVPAPAATLLQQLVLIGAPLRRGAARGLAEQAGAPAAVAALQKARLLRHATLRGRPAVQLAHDRIRQLLQAALPPESLATRHADVAARLERIGDVDAAVITRLFLAGELPRRAAPHARVAGDEAMERMAFDRAAELRRVALAGGDEADRGADTRALADALGAAGRAAESAELLLAAIDLGGSPQPGSDRRVAAELYIGAGHLDRGRAVLREVLADVRMRRPEGAVGSLLSALYWRLRLLLRGLRVGTSAAQVERIDACWTVAGCLGYFDPIAALGVQSRHLMLALDAGEPVRLARALALELVYIGGTGKTSARETRIRALLDSVRPELPDPTDGAFVRVAEGYKALHDGQFRRSIDALADAERLYRRRGRSDWGRSMGLTHRLVTQTFTGEFGDLTDDYRELAARYRQADDLLALANLDLAVGYLCDLADDDPDRAAERIDAGLAGWGDPAPLSFLYMGTLARFQRALYVGDGPAARAAVDAAWPKLKVLHRFVSERVLLFWMRGASRLACGDAAGSSRREVERCRDVIRDSGADWAAGLHAVLTAGLQFGAGEAAESAATLRSAQQRFADADMLAWSHAAGWRAAEVGGHLDQRIGSRRSLRAIGISQPQAWAGMYAPFGPAFQPEP